MLGQRLDLGIGIDLFFRAQPGYRTSHNISHVVHTCLQRGESYFLLNCKNLRNVFYFQVPQLHLLARRDIDDAIAKLLGYGT